jgi:23S rRNA pseudouridine2605 synthase
MCAEVGHPVKRLQRVAYGPLRLGDLAEGGVRKLTPAEVERLRALEPESAGRDGARS